MDKIYSRPRIPLPNFGKTPFGKFPKGSKMNKKRKLLLSAIFVIGIALYTVKSLENYIAPTIDLLSENIAESTATKVFHEQASEVMKTYQYEDLCTVTKDANGNVTMLKANVVPINQIQSEVAVKVQDILNNSENTMTIKLRNIYGK